MPVKCYRIPCGEANITVTAASLDFLLKLDPSMSVHHNAHFHQRFRYQFVCEISCDLETSIWISISLQKTASG